jgi:hypothetical protein
MKAAPLNYLSMTNSTRPLGSACLTDAVPNGFRRTQGTGTGVPFPPWTLNTFGRRTVAEG